MPSASLAQFPDVARPDPAGPRPPYRFVAALALLGAALLTAGTLLHPGHADPGSPAAAFAEYAGVSRGEWVAAHLVQLGGVAGLVVLVVMLARAVDGTRGSAWARVTTVFATAALATAAVLQAVDGVALKAVVDLWSGAGEDRSALFVGALVVRQVEIGLDALFALLLAVAFLAVGMGLLAAPNGSRGLGALAVVAAGAAAVNGVALALSGFSAATMLATTVSGAVALVWMLLAAVWSWRRSVLHRP
ncbi:hypothetical protein JOD57_004050 [Geodermatophilus bullaregiensis]|uniref:hypothetical protein n=1 Tax=Geodermatophilus bullaregiensis TaxID=1564160 RepID=UPI0019580725|nr:hypothetical protein [Geodermatophilus bullaregiensis]MBM7808213.1 hypothetical protein [Geodermatophilus bullaregiensis]